MCLVYISEMKFMYVSIMLLAFLDTHALIHFDEENSSSIVPLSQVVREDTGNLYAGHLCAVLWSNKKKYTGKLICSGSIMLMLHNKRCLEISCLYWTCVIAW